MAAIGAKTGMRPTEQLPIINHVWVGLLSKQ
jgi:hypothetical protein